MSDGEEASPKIVNMVQPVPALTLVVDGKPIVVDMEKFMEAARVQGLQISKGDVLSIGAFKDLDGRWRPNYSTIRVEKRAPKEEGE